MICRSEDRGLGILTWEMHRALQPDRTLLIDMGPLARGFPMHPERYPGATAVRWEGGQLPEAAVRGWLAGLDVVYSAETFYDWQVCRWAAEAGVATVLHVMPEFFHHHAPGHGLPEPTCWWAPTPWRLSRLPAGTRLVPVPVALDRWPAAVAAGEGPLRVLHVAGHRAMGDRNGTTIVLQALRGLGPATQVTLSGQDGRLPSVRAPRHVHLDSRPRGTADYWSTYGGHDVLVMPRRYGGLCLPVQEAMGAGLAVVMPECSPNGWWPTVQVPCHPGPEVATPGGLVRTWNTPPSGVAAALDRLAGDRAALAGQQAASRAWGVAHSWQALGPLYRAELARAADSHART